MPDKNGNLTGTEGAGPYGGYNDYPMDSGRAWRAGYFWALAHLNDPATQHDLADYHLALKGQAPHQISQTKIPSPRTSSEPTRPNYSLDPGFLARLAEDWTP